MSQLLLFQAKESNSNPFGVMESSFGSFGLAGPQSGDDQSLPADFGLSFNQEARHETGQPRFSGGQNLSGEAWERMVGSNRTSATSRSGSFGGQHRTSPGQGPSPAHSSHSLAGSQEKLPSMPERRSKDSSLGERTAALGRSSGGLVPTARSNSPVSGYSSEGSDAGPALQYSEKEQLDDGHFKIPTMPAPKSGFKSSAARPKTKGLFC